MKKIMLSVFTLILVLAMLMTPVFASGSLQNLPDESAIEESSIQPRSYECSDCDGGIMYYYDTTYSEWDFVQYVSCREGYNDHLDLKYEQTVIVRYKCGHCNIKDRDVSTKTKYECQ